MNSATFAGIFYSHISTEEKRRNNKGQVEWAEIRQDNHLLDCSVIAHALADPQWLGGGVQLLRGPEMNRKQESNNSPGRVSIRSDWMGR